MRAFCNGKKTPQRTPRTCSLWLVELAGRAQEGPGLGEAVEEGQRLMSVQTDVLRELVELFNARKAIDVARFFTEDFRLEDPGAGVIRTGLDGAQSMMEALRALAHEGHLEILDMFESGNRVAARWSYKGPGASFAMMSIYEFNGKRIQRDWGILARAPWAD